MPLAEHLRIEGKCLYVLDQNHNWLKALEAEADESTEDLLNRWNELYIRMIEEKAEQDKQRTANILSWIIPIVIFALAYIVSAFFD